MSRSVRAGELADTARFEAMSREDCIDEWRRTMGGQSLKYVSVQFMRSALAYEAQVKAHGGHSTAVRKALKAALKTDQRSSEAGSWPSPFLFQGSWFLELVMIFKSDYPPLEQVGVWAFRSGSFIGFFLLVYSVLLTVAAALAVYRLALIRDPMEDRQ